MSETPESVSDNPELTLEQLSEGVDRLLARCRDVLGYYAYAAALGNKGVYFREPGDIDEEKAPGSMIENIREKEVELSPEEQAVIDGYFKLAAEKQTELSEKAEIQTLMHLQGMHEHLTIQLQKGAKTVEIVSASYSGTKHEIMVTVPSNIEEYVLLETALANLSLGSFSSDRPGKNYLKVPGLVSLSWLQNYFKHEVSTSRDRDPGHYL